MHLLLWTALALAMIACAKNQAPVEPPARQVTPVAVAPVARAPTVAQPEPTAVAADGTKVLWANVVPTEGCFYFSGPVGHGRDTTVGSIAKLEIEGEKAVLHLGDTRFDGQGLDGRYRFTREVERKHEGKWRITERIEAELSAAGLRGSYSYEECDLEGEQGCPGKCTLSADFFARGLVPEAPVLD